MSAFDLWLCLAALMAGIAWYFYRLGFRAGVTTLTRTIDECLAAKRRQDAGLEDEGV